MARNSACIEYGLWVGADAIVTHSKSLYFPLFRKDLTSIFK